MMKWYAMYACREKRSSEQTETGVPMSESIQEAGRPTIIMKVLKLGKKRELLRQPVLPRLEHLTIECVVLLLEDSEGAKPIVDIPEEAPSGILHKGEACLPLWNLHISVLQSRRWQKDGRASREFDDQLELGHDEVTTCLRVEIPPCIEGTPAHGTIGEVEVVIACDLRWEIDGTGGEYAAVDVVRQVREMLVEGLYAVGVASV